MKGFTTVQWSSELRQFVFKIRKRLLTHNPMYFQNGIEFFQFCPLGHLGVSLLKYLSKFVDRTVLDLSYKLYVRPHLDYGDVIFHNQRDDLMKLIELVQYKAALIVSGCRQGTSRERLHDEIGWESLSDRRWAHRLTTFYKIESKIAPSYLSDHVPEPLLLHSLCYRWFSLPLNAHALIM